MLSLKFILPDQLRHYRSKPARVLAHLLGHEGPGSVCAYLRRNGWVDHRAVSTAAVSENASVQYLRITCHLTREGYGSRLHIPSLSPAARLTMRPGSALQGRPRGVLRLPRPPPGLAHRAVPL